MREKSGTCVRRIYWFASLMSILVVLGSPFVPQAFAAAAEVSVTIPGVTDSLPGGAINADSFQWGVAPTSSSSGQQGAVKVHDILIRKSIDQASPSFFKSCVTGAHYPKVTIVMRKAGGSQEFLQITLTNVFVTSINFGGSRGSEEPEETITFAYASVVVQYPQQQPSEIDCTSYPICVAAVLPRS